jgi:hypothetical protein
LGGKSLVRRKACGEAKSFRPKLDILYIDVFLPDYKKFVSSVVFPSPPPEPLSKEIVRGSERGPTDLRSLTTSQSKNISDGGLALPPNPRRLTLCEFSPGFKAGAFV